MNRLCYIESGGLGSRFARRPAKPPFKEGAMPIRLHSRVQRAAIASLLCCGLLLTACTRSAATGVVPTAGPTSDLSGTQGSGSSTQPASDQDATMAAIGTQVAGQLTQTAVAAGGVVN